MNIFERASRKKLRFESAIGFLTTEQLWDLPLVAELGTSLDGLARAVHTKLKDFDEVSFVDTKPNPEKIEMQLRLDILKHIIDAKMAQRSEAEQAAKTAEHKRKLYAALEAKTEDELKGKSRKELEEEIAELEK